MRKKFKIFFLLPIIILLLTSCSWVQFSQEVDDGEVASLEEYLIDFSKKIEGHRLLTGSLSFDSDTEKFFSILELYYYDKEIIQKAKEYPIRVFPEGNSYVLILCDKKSKIILYKDLGKTITFVDYPYWREGKRVPCQE